MRILSDVLHKSFVNCVTRLIFNLYLLYLFAVVKCIDKHSGKEVFILTQTLITIAIILYLAIMICVGIRYSKRAQTINDFYLGGRKLGPIVTAMSAEASDMSSWLLMGLPAVAYLTGIADAGWTAIGLAVGTYLNWLFVAKRVRRYSAELEAITVPQFFSKRFGDSKSLLAAIAGVVIVIFFIPYTASGFAAIGKLFTTLFGIDYMTAMIVGAIIIILYTVLGGFLAVSTTDLIQSIVMSFALLVVLGFGVIQAGGLSAVMDNASSMLGYLSMTATHSATDGSANTYSTLTIISTTAWGLGYFGMPHILLRFMAIEDENKLHISRRVATTWVFISMAVAIFIGVVGSAMVSAGSMGELADAETIIVTMASLLSEVNPFFAIVAGIIMAGIMAATMSTSDSQLLAASSSISQNLVAEFLGVKLSAKKNMLVARGTIVIIAIIAVFIAQDPDSSVFGIVSFAWAGFGAAFGPVMLLALFWKRANKQGALAGMVAGGAMVFIWKYGIATLGGVFAIYELLPAFIVGLVAMVVVSLLTPAPDEAITDIFDKVKG